MPPDLVTIVFLVHLVATLAMTGAIWIVQAVHYPLFAAVGSDSFARYAAKHQRRITLVVAPLMIVELATAVALVAGMAPPGIPLWMPISGLVLVGIVWISTAFVQVPLHRALGDRFDEAVHARLVATNWIRTSAWSVRSALVLGMIATVVA